ncbi:MAG TPA: glycosyltransferase, partial [Polyangiaceae bacterium]|nr:glycosyltransferase [Polyangiaceae bacterium]
MKVHLISYEDTQAWILGQLTTHLAEALQVLGVQTSIGRRADPSADINHHVIYLGYDGKPSRNDTLMITHVDTEAKVRLLSEQLRVARMGICVSSDTMNKLIALGVPQSRLSFVNYPSPQTGQIKRRKLHIGITSRCYNYGSKREYLLGELAPHLPPDLFVFHIMGSGWDVVMQALSRHGSEVVFYGDFDAVAYRELWQKLDYYLYLGHDEGSTGLLDALEAGVPTIATPQGFHVDVGVGLVHAFNDITELRLIFQKLADERLALRNSAAHINWPAYAREHLAIWERVLAEGNPAREPAQESKRVDSNPKHAWVSAMPQQPGPGGMAHRPRLLVIADEPVSDALRVWRNLAALAPPDLRVMVTADGQLLTEDVYRAPAGLEVRIVDLRTRATVDLVQLSLDFDAVLLWDSAPFAVVDALLARRKPNYLLRTEALARLSARYLPFQSMPRRSEEPFYGLVRRLTAHSPARVMAAWTGSPGQAFGSEYEPSRIRAHHSRMAAVFFGDEAWAPLIPNSNKVRFSVPSGDRVSGSNGVPSVSNQTPSKDTSVFFEALFEVIGAPQLSPKPDTLLWLSNKARALVTHVERASRAAR